MHLARTSSRRPAGTTTLSAGILAASGSPRTQSFRYRIHRFVDHACLDRPGEIFCFDSLDEYSALFNGTIQVTGIEMSGTFTDPADLSALFSQSESLQAKFEETGRRCVERNGDMLKYVGTAATVRDMVAIADALDGPGSLVNYYGDSYGTLIGNVFLNSKNACFPRQDARLMHSFQCSLRLVFSLCSMLLLIFTPACRPCNPRQRNRPHDLAGCRHISGPSHSTVVLYTAHAALTTLRYGNAPMSTQTSSTKAS